MVAVVPRCPGCGAAAGEQHDRVCDVARCRATGRQFHVCGHQSAPSAPHEPDRWMGRWPGEGDCARLGWYARHESGQGWVPCQGDAPGAQPDLPRLHAQAVWDPIGQSWTPKGRSPSADLRRLRRWPGGAPAPRLPLWEPLAVLGIAIATAAALPFRIVPFILLIAGGAYWLVLFRATARRFDIHVRSPAASPTARPGTSPDPDAPDAA